VVTTDTGHKFILDATTVFDSGDLAKANTKKVELTHQISAIKTNKILNLHYLELPTATARPKVITKLVSQWLESLPSTVRRRKKVFNASGYNLEVEASSSGPKPKGGCIFSVMDPGMSVPDYSRRIKSVLDDKRRKYSSKNTGLPLVVMVGDAVGLVRTDEGAIDKTLFGQHQITFSLSGDDPPQMQRDRSGYFTPRNAPDGTWSGKNTGVSAVMYASLKEKGSFQMQVFHNPLPHLTLEEQTFQKMPQLLRFSTTPGITMRWTITNPEHLRVYFS
jgi:hypothetical protein